MKIRRIELTPVYIPYEAPVAPYRSHCRETLGAASTIVRVETEDGLVGWGEGGGEFTTDPNDVVATIHNRMPAILVPDAYELWLDPDVRDEHALTHWLSPYPAEEMTARPVSRLVNDPKHDSPELIA